MEEIIKRVSIREYLDKEVEKEKVKKLLLAGEVAPSAKNQRPWEFIVCDDKELLKEIGNRCPNHKMAKDASLAIIVLCNTNKIISPLYTHQDLSAATENILLEATHLGLGSVWLGVAPNEERMNNLKEIFELPDDYYAFSIIVIGYPKKEIIKERKYDSSLIHHNKLNNKYE
jgi:nitroreductase